MIERSLFDSYVRALDANIELIKPVFDDLYLQCKDLSTADAKKLIYAVCASTIAERGMAAAVCASEFYNDVREQSEQLEGYKAVPVDAFNPRFLRGDIKETFKELKTLDKILPELSGRAVKHTMNYADETIMQNARRDPARPKWALVPHLGACPWCVMIGSNGFAYNSIGTVGGARHKSCKCTPVVDFDIKNPQLDGYNPAGLRVRYSMCEETIKDYADREWKKLSPEEQKAYETKRHSAYANFLRKKTTAEMATRDKEWLRSGVIPPVDYSKNPRKTYGKQIIDGKYNKENIVNRGAEWRDIVVHDTLASNGLKVATRSTEDVPEGYKHIDLYIFKQLWEAKSPEDHSGGNFPEDSLNFIGRNLQKAKSQFRNQYDEINKSKLDYKGDYKVVLNMYYKDIEINSDFMDRLHEDMQVQKIDEVLLITKGDEEGGLGKLQRIKN